MMSSITNILLPLPSTTDCVITLRRFLKNKHKCLFYSKTCRCVRSGGIQIIDSQLAFPGEYGYAWSKSTYGVSHAWRVATLRFLDEKVITGTDSQAVHAFPVLCPWGLRLPMVRFYAASRLP